MAKRLVPTRRVAGEFLLIIVGVLTAFALEAWWSAYVELKEQRVYLGAIALEFDLVVEELGELTETHRTNVDDLTALRRLLLSGRTELPRDSVLGFSRRLWRNQPFSPSMPVYVEFKESGRLSRIASGELARTLAEYEIAAEQSLLFDRYVRESMVQSWEPVLSSRIPFVLTSDEEDWARQVATSSAALAGDLEFMNLMATRLDVETQLLEARRGLLAAAIHVSEGLSAETGG
jgi:hypothetical protein